MTHVSSKFTIHNSTRVEAEIARQILRLSNSKTLGEALALELDLKALNKPLLAMSAFDMTQDRRKTIGKTKTLENHVRRVVS